MRRLYLQIYATVLGILFLLGALLAVSWGLFAPSDEHWLQPMARMASRLLPGPEADPVELRAVLEDLHEQLGVSVAVRDAEGALVASAGSSPLEIDAGWEESRFVRRHGARAVALRLADGRWLLVRHHRHPGGGAAVGFMLLVALAVAAGAYPLVRRLTRRLERLQNRVDALGQGALSTRVEVEGRDEVAELARSFNRAAARIERLVEAQRMLLAGASHELRSPLTRIRVGVELLGDEARPEIRERIARDIEELDRIIGELLLASRIEAAEAIERSEDVDVLELAKKEAARYDAAVTGDAVSVPGDANLLGKMLRNLLDNGRRHAPDSSLHVEVRSKGGQVLLRVSDHGPGLSPEEQERVFEPFYRGPAATRRPGDGTGLGLAIVRRIARLHGGEARCLAREGGGTIFEVQLPAGGSFV